MQRPIPWFWIFLLGFILLLPGPTGRFLLDVLGGLTLTIILLPFLAAGAGLIAWQFLRRKLRQCPACGTTFMAAPACPACGHSMESGVDQSFEMPWFGRSDSEESIVDASNVTINIEAVDVELDDSRPPD